MNVLLGVDDSPNSKTAAQLLQRIQFPAESVLYLLHVNPLDEWLRLGTSGRSLRMVEQIRSIRAEAATRMGNVLNHMEETFRSSSLAVHSLVTDGVPGPEILRTITEHHIDLMVLGTRGLSKISGFLLGSVSEWVLNEAPCSVLVVRGKTRPKKSTAGMNILIATDGSSDAQEGVELVKKVGLPHLHGADPSAYCKEEGSSNSTTFNHQPHSACRIYEISGRPLAISWPRRSKTVGGNPKSSEASRDQDCRESCLWPRSRRDYQSRQTDSSGSCGRGIQRINGTSAFSLGKCVSQSRPLCSVLSVGRPPSSEQ